MTISSTYALPADQTVSRNVSRAAVPLILPAICLLAFAIRFVAVLQIQEMPVIHELVMDEAIYENYALEILSGDMAPSDAHFKNPLYPYFLAAIYRVLGHGSMGVPMVQLLLDILTCLMVYHIGRRCFQRHVGRIAALMYASYGIAIFYTGLHLPETLTIFLFTASLLQLLRAVENNRSGSMFTAGAVFALLVLIRANAALILTVLPFWFLVSRKHHSGRQGALLSFGVFCAGVFLVTTPIIVKNLLTTGEFMPSAHGGINFYIGNNPRATGAYMLPEGVSNLPEEQIPSSIRVAEEHSGRNLTPAQASRFWFREGFQWLKTHPSDRFRLYLRKIALFWRGEEIGLNIDFVFFRKRLPIFQMPTISFGLMAPLALIGMALAFFMFKQSRLPIVFVFAYMGSVVLFFVCDRYRLPIVPILSVFAAFAVTRFFELLFRPRIATAWALAGILLLAFLINGNNNRFTRATYTAEAYYHLLLGKHLYQQNRYEEALETLQKSLTNDRYKSSALFLMGLIHHSQGRNDLSIRMLHQAIDINPDFRDAHAQLGIHYGITGDLDKALLHLEKAHALAPEDIDVLINLGIARLKANQVDGSIVVLLKALERAPDNAQVSKALGAACFRKGHLKAAESYLKKTLEIDPGDLESVRLREEVGVALANYERGIARLKAQWKENAKDHDLAVRIGNTYATAGELEPATAFFRRAQDIRPDSVIALSLLGKALAGQHLFQEAEAAFLEAVRLDPENARLCYNLSCLYSMKNNVEASLEWLQNAMERGYQRWDRIMDDPDLDNLRASRLFAPFREQRFAGGVFR